MQNKLKFQKRILFFYKRGTIMTYNKKNKINSNSNSTKSKGANKINPNNTSKNTYNNNTPTSKSVNEPTVQFLTKRVGILHNNFLNGIVRSDVPGRFEDVFIDRKDLNGAPFGMRVVCQLTENPFEEGVRQDYYYRDDFSGTGMAKGRIIEVLGDPVSNDATMKGILIAHNLDEEFPEGVLEQARKFEMDIPESEIESELKRGRKDFRNEQIVTIDGADTKDIDDALSIRVTDGITYLSVHIADVTHYVKEGSPIDVEALSRGTSVYLADRVIPMLPQILSNNLCSLNPNKPRFALTATMGYDKNAYMVSFKVEETVIESSQRLTYDEVFELLSDNESTRENNHSDDVTADDLSKIEPFRGMLTQIYELSKKLRLKRFENGAINFDFLETKVKLDYEKNVTDVYAAKATFANEMIEECMVAANEAIAKEFSIKKAPFIYRVHEETDIEKIQRFTSVAKLLGEKIQISTKPSPKEIQAVISSIEDKPYKETLMQLLLRSMAKAEYSHECLGHFGLALKFYCHFTSPIRRYPDLFIHRVIKSYIGDEKRNPAWTQNVVTISKMNSDSEKNSTQAERESIDYKTAQYMKQFIGESFEGQVTGMLDFGIFVRLDNTIEGMAPFRTLNNYYEFFEELMVVRSSNNRKVIRIGDRVVVKVVGADLVARRVEFLLYEKSLNDETDSKILNGGQNFNKFSQGNSNRNRNAGSGRNDSSTSQRGKTSSSGKGEKANSSGQANSLSQHGKASTGRKGKSDNRGSTNKANANRSFSKFISKTTKPGLGKKKKR
jgi:ribonuclease R